MEQSVLSVEEESRLRDLLNKYIESFKEGNIYSVPQILLYTAAKAYLDETR